MMPISITAKFFLARQLLNFVVLSCAGLQPITARVSRGRSFDTFWCGRVQGAGKKFFFLPLHLFARLRRTMRVGPNTAISDLQAQLLEQSFLLDQLRAFGGV